MIRWLHILLYRLFRKRYYFALSHSAMVFAARLPYGGIEGMIREANPFGGWQFYSDEMLMRWVALCYNRPTCGGFDGIFWEEVKA